MTLQSTSTHAEPNALCELDSIPDGEGREFWVDSIDSVLHIVVVRRGDGAYAYINSCPHNYIPLNDQPDRFVTYDHEWIICSTHGAVFRYEDGYCEDGPCKGKGLTPFPVDVVRGLIVPVCSDATKQDHTEGR